MQENFKSPLTNSLKLSNPENIELAIQMYDISGIKKDMYSYNRVINFTCSL